MFNLHSIYISRILWSKYQKSLNSGLLSVFYCGLDMHSFNTKNMLNLPKYYIATGENVCPRLPKFVLVCGAEPWRSCPWYEGAGLHETKEPFKFNNNNNKNFK